MFRGFTLRRSLAEMKLRAKKSISFFREGGLKETVEPGKIFFVPQWEASILVRRGLAEPVVEPIDTASLYRILSLEELKRFQLHGLPADFYVRCLSMLKQLREKNSDEAQKFKAGLESLTLLRLQKIAKMAAKGVDNQKEREKMTPEEEDLYDVILNLINEWRKALFNIV